MHYKSFLIKYGEIGCKGKNRYKFEEALMKQIRHFLHGVDGKFEVTREHGRIYVDTEGEYDYDDTVETLQRVFGIVTICPVVRLEGRDYGMLKGAALKYMQEVYGDRDHVTFKVDTRRADKTYPGTSETINAEIGEVILNGCPNTKVDVHHPDVMLHVEIRDTLAIYSVSIPGPGGMPVGTNGKAMLLLSGGIDSPVAGYMIAKRGVLIEAVYFHAPPYTSERAKQKVIDLAGLVSRYAGPVNLHIVNFTDVQMCIYETCPHEELTIIMRRYMMRIAEEIAAKTGSLALVTGESIGQVASQTVQSLVCTNEVCTMPVFRPLIGFDKQEIIDRSLKLGMYDTSIEPYEDCCTIFVAKHPVTKPIPEHIRKSEEKCFGRIEDMVKKAVDTEETVLCAVN